MAVFALVHGVCVGGWARDRVVPYLQRAGHTTITIDLPGDDAAAKFSDHADIVVRALAEASDEVVLVGHSTGGLTLPIVAAYRPVTELVFLCAAIPVPGQSVAERGVEWQAIDPAEWQVDNGAVPSRSAQTDFAAMSRRIRTPTSSSRPFHSCGPGF